MEDRQKGSEKMREILAIIIILYALLSFGALRNDIDTNTYRGTMVEINNQKVLILYKNFWNYDTYTGRMECGTLTTIHIKEIKIYDIKE